MTADNELDAAGIADAQLRADYRHCRGLAQEHGRSYFLATRFLPAARRPAVHALYGFARTADDIVDNPTPGVTVQAKTAGLQTLTAQLRHPASATDPSVRAALDAARRFELDPQLFEDFLASMQMDLTVTSYRTFDDLKTYVHGSAAVIGLMVLPILGTVVPMQQAAPFAADLGVAFQLTNFIRDVGEDLRLGRIYLPLESLAMFGIDRAHLERGIVDEPVRRLLKREITRARGFYGRAEPGIGMLAPGARGCVRAAFQLYGDILTAVEDADYQIFGPRIRVSRGRRAQIAAGTMADAAAAGIRRRFRDRPAIPA